MRNTTTRFKKFRRKNSLNTYQRQDYKLVISAILVLFLLVAAFTLLGVSISNESKSLVLGIWSEYIDSSILSEFSKKYNVPVQVVNYDSNEALSQKLKRTIIDVFIPSDYYLTYLINNSIVEKLDFEKLNISKEKDYIEVVVEKIDKSKDNNEILDYGVPYFWGYNALTFKTQNDYDRVKKIVGEEGIKDMSFFFDERVLSLPDFKIGIVDDRSFLIPLGLKKIGKNYLQPANLSEAKQALDAIKPYLNRWTIIEDTSIDDQIRSNQIQASFTYSGWTNCFFTCDDPFSDAVVVSLNKSHLWVDLMAINKFSKKKTLSYNLINFIMEKRNQVKNVSEIGDFTIIKEAYDEAKNEDLIDNKVEILNKLQAKTIDYDLVGSENFAEIKKLYDEARA